MMSINTASDLRVFLENIKRRLAGVRDQNLDSLGPQHGRECVDRPHVVVDDQDVATVEANIGGMNPGSGRSPRSQALVEALDKHPNFVQQALAG